MAITDQMTKADFDAQTDDPKLAFTELAGNVDTYNALVAAFGDLIEAGLHASASGLFIDAGDLKIKLASDAGLEIATNELKVKLQATSGIQRVAGGLKVDIGGLTEVALDEANDYFMFLDATDSLLKKAKIAKIGPQVAIGTVTRDQTLASGSVTVSGLGFTPKKIDVIVNKDGAPNLSFGFGDSSANVRSFYNNHNAAAEAFKSVATSIGFSIDSGSAFTSVDISNVGSDGFDFDFTKTGSPTGTINVFYAAMG